MTMICQCCGSEVEPEDLEAPYSGIEPGCPYCGSNDFLEEGD
jgi:DNA-directed RNA polymerase subunit RPC12/RpoP